MEDTRQMCFDSDVSDCWSSSVGARAPTVETTVCCARLDCFDCDVPVCVPDTGECLLKGVFIEFLTIRCGTNI